MQSVERATPTGGLRPGALLTAANLEAFAFVAGAGMRVGATAAPLGRLLALSVAFGALASLGVALPIAWCLAAGDRSRSGLLAARDWLVRNNAIVLAAVLLTIGAMLIGSGLESL